MPFTNDGRQFVAYGLGSELTNNYMSYVGIGSGSGTATVNDSALIAEISRGPITGAPDFTEVRKVSMQADFNSVQMSGTTLTEFGFMASGAALTGSIWSREGFGSIIFDGTNELQIVGAFEVI